MKLKTGVYKNKELAEWFGITANSFSKNKMKKINELKNFCDFKILENGKIEVLEVFIEEYSKMDAYSAVRDRIDEVWSEDGLDSCKRVSMQIKNELKNELALTEGTLYNYTRKSRNELYGVPFGERGKIGSCSYTWCKREGEGVDAAYVPFSEEETKIKEDLQKKYFGNVTEKQMFVKGMVETGEIKKEDAWQVLEELTGMDNHNFMSFLGELQSKLGAVVVRGTLVERDKDVMLLE